MRTERKAEGKVAEDQEGFVGTITKTLITCEKVEASRRQLQKSEPLAETEVEEWTKAWRPG